MYDKCLVLMLALSAGGCAAHRPAPVDERSTTAEAGQAVTVAGSNVATQPAVNATDSPPAVFAGEGATVRALPSPDLSKRVLDEDGLPAASPVDPTVVALLNTANQQATRGEHDRAAATVERAVQIAPADAWLWHRFAIARLDQGRPAQAEHLAAKSLSLSADDPGLQASNWQLIAKVRKHAGDEKGARAALEKADDLSAW